MVENWTRYHKKGLKFLHWALAPICLHIITVHMTKFPSPPPPILHTVSDQKLDGEKAWELYPMFTIKHINLLTPFSPLPLLL